MAKQADADDSLIVLCMNRFVESGLKSAVLNDFEAANKCKIKLINVENSTELLKRIKEDKDEHKYDVVIGLDNAFFTDADVQDYFKAVQVETDQLNDEALFDPANKMIPYGYGYLSIVYNSNIIPVPPESFGELQDSKFYNQMAICDPQSSGIGRSILLWSVALFGTEGYQHLWKSLRKNIVDTYPSWLDSFKALADGKCGMIFGFSSTASWYLENTEMPLPLQVSMLKEGSYLYVEAIGIAQSTKRGLLAEKLVNYLISPTAQQYVIFKLGLFPVNNKTLLPVHFTNIPFSTYTVNKKLSPESIVSGINEWLNFWQQLFSYRY
jgi:thiamine transport system substrate-binding protein